jgi:hypothetical protein
MTIFIHIGLNKTGSSSLQAFCHQQRAVLHAHGLEYPKAGVHGYAHYGVSKLLTGRPSAPEVVLAEGLEDEIRSAVAGQRDVLLSSEYFFLATEEEVGRVKTFLAGFQTDSKVIVYLRRHDAWIASLFNQALKTVPTLKPWHSDIRDYTIWLLGNRKSDTRYPVILDRWAARFGTPNLIVRPFEAAQFKMGEYLWDVLGNIRRDLPRQLKRKAISPIRVNESLPEDMLRTITSLKASNSSAGRKRANLSRLLRKERLPDAVKKPESEQEGHLFTLPPYLRRAIVNLFADDYRYIAEHYLQSEDGLLFKERVNGSRSGLDADDSR